MYFMFMIEQKFDAILWREAIDDFPKVVCKLIDNAAAGCQTDTNEI